jgi:hypothetical protein
MCPKGQTAGEQRPASIGDCVFMALFLGLKVVKSEKQVFHK